MSRAIMIINDLYSSIILYVVIPVESICFGKLASSEDI